VRDKTRNGELDAAHVLYGLVYGVHLGIGGPKQDMAVLMTLNHNGQGISLARHLLQQGAKDGPSLARLIKAAPRTLTFAHTFPTGTHAMWLYYWLASHGINPLTEVNTITIPPPEMVQNVRLGNMDGFCAGEPWHARGIFDQVSFSVAASQDVWADHPEKVLGTTADFVKRHPNTARAMTMALLEAARYIDQPDNRSEVARLIAAEAYVNAPLAVIVDRFLGNYADGLGKSWHDPHAMRFYNDGQIPFPYLSDGMWFLTQHKRWGLLKAHPDYLAIARQINQTDLYRQAATQTRTPLPESDMRTSTLMDGGVWDGKHPADYADRFEVSACSTARTL
jgi:nitrate/nitrite transport system substrate-binding protein